MIYRMNAAALTNVGTPFNHGVQGRTNASLSPIPDDGTPGLTQFGRRIWGVQTYQNRLYYAVWWEDSRNISLTESNENWSVALDNNGDFIPSSAQRHFALPNFATTSWSHPAASIDFSPSGKMFLAERYWQYQTMILNATFGAHHTRILRYWLSGPNWVTDPSVTHQIGGDASTYFTPNMVTGAGAFGIQPQTPNMKPIPLPIAEPKSALSGIGKVIHPRTTLPVLQHVKVERTNDGWIALTGTDLDRFVTMRLEHPAEGPPCAVLVPFDQLQQLSKNCGRDERLLIDITENGPVIKFALADNLGETKVKPLPVTEFPETPRLKSEAIPLPPTLRTTLHEAKNCASTDSTRYVLNGTFIDASNPKGFYVVGTDGKHLSSANSFTLPINNSILIPNHKFLGWKEFNNDGEWQMKADDKHPALLTALALHHPPDRRQIPRLACDHPQPQGRENAHHPRSGQARSLVQAHPANPLPRSRPL